MMFRADDLAVRHEAFRRAAPNRNSTTFGPEFDRAFAVWDAQQRLRKRLLSLLVLMVVAVIGGVVFMGFSPDALRESCANANGRQGPCESVD